MLVHQYQCTSPFLALTMRSDFVHLKHQPAGHSSLQFTHTVNDENSQAASGKSSSPCCDVHAECSRKLCIDCLLFACSMLWEDTTNHVLCGPSNDRDTTSSSTLQTFWQHLSQQHTPDIIMTNLCQYGELASMNLHHSSKLGYT